MNVIEISLADIELGDRLRAVDVDWAQVIAASVMEHGQRTPIEVREQKGRGKKPYALIAGAHRIRAVFLAGLDSIFAIVLKADDLQAKLLEIDENLCRRELSALDRAVFLAERKRVYEELHPEAKHGGDRKSDQARTLAHLIPSFTEATAQKLGVDASTLRRSLARFSSISPDVREKIAGTWLAESGSQLDALAKEVPEMQRKVADFVVQWPGVRQVKEIVRQIRKLPVPPEPGKLEKFLAFFRKCDPEEQQTIVEHAAGQMPAVAFEAAWTKGSAYQREMIVDFLAPHLPGFVRESEVA
ncbi:ParB N-terminal domain-containing protein [Acidomonas methanolica]|uniref:Chromosome partitioning nuclease protein ParB n=1 Tax=Acidomonas methanolica NBRC 104435 TaxID=1231351 RepID=A0A023D7T1_ACIMT|nr:ParB N-terminal domain-containing protein [Acidomonas methanolica]MBU2653456.1 ParB N-terminal domain-containing protein [Acidomonas methanolica]TCS32409.1 ParB family chromosome partitioning protein [Acidomonas methanolica]GAJ30217.1 chromosome partitioning nuclease protein ParB [Acidomonas methanolica NBRC 104435]GBQ52854.1 putative transcriptional regulator [Acidomonas methanolica]GEK97845.1 hypothetical protein AME01nite_03440 [Acidomonas methanolica NBRC 104435]